MGRDIDKVHYCKADFAQFQSHLTTQLKQLREIITQDNFGEGELMLGAELEMYLIDDNGQVNCVNQALIEQLQDKQYQVELNRYNLELNLSAIPQKGRPFTKIVNELKTKFKTLVPAAKAFKADVLPIGILPTLRAEHLNEEYMTEIPRYRCLSDQIYHQRGSDFDININGKEPLQVSFKNICAEGANTSFQVHLMVANDKFVDTYNAAQLTLPLVTALAANSAIFLGQQLWDETRIALFKQSIDSRSDNGEQWQKPARVNFGFGWLQGSPWNLFAEAVSLYQPILPCMTELDHKHKLPGLDELNLHLGTIWPWHRPVYSNHGNGHIRIEFRALPAGPTFIDMAANSAFALGLAVGFAKKIENYLPYLPFRYAEYNFYRAAQHGLSAKLLWPRVADHQVKEVPLLDILSDAVPVAEQGLVAMGVDQDEINQYLSIIRERIVHSKTGASWQKQSLSRLEQRMPKDQACRQLVKDYLALAKSETPVSRWPISG